MKSTTRDVVLARVSMAVKGRCDHSNSCEGKTLVHYHHCVTWSCAGRLGTGDVESPTSRLKDNRKWSQALSMA